jgi:uncharacterized protein DUF6683
VKRSIAVVAALAVDVLPSAVARGDDAAGHIDVAVLDAQARGSVKVVASTTVEPRVPKLPAAMALAAPSGERVLMEGYLREYFHNYRGFANALGFAPDDLGGAAAIYVAGAYMTYRHVELAESEIVALEAQLRAGLAGTRSLASASVERKQGMYEHLVVHGMIMAATEGQVAAAREPAVRSAARAAAKEQLAAFLGVDPDRVVIDEHGLSLVRAARKPRPPMLDDIETVTFIEASSYRLGMTPYTLVMPVALFKSGDVLLDIAELTDPSGHNAQRAAHARDWSTWRRGASGLEWQECLQRTPPCSWKKFVTTSVARLPKGHRLEARYHRTSPGGYIQYGHILDMTWSDLQFRGDGRFTSATGWNGSSTNVVARTGTYTIDGYVLTLAYGDGTTEWRTIVSDPKDPKTMWIDGASYARD